MPDEQLHATRAIAAPAEAIFAVLADPARHPAIDGTGWVREPADDASQLTAAGQVFRMAMHHDQHPDGGYQMANRVQVFDPPAAISWEPGQDAEGGPQFGGWVWRYDLVPAGSGSTEVTLSYDWSAVPPPVRGFITFPPFPPSHLENSLAHLAELVTDD